MQIDKKKLVIPLLDLKREYSLLKKEIDAQIKECLTSQHWILGEKVAQFEKELSKYLKSKYVVGVNSGTDALLLCLRAQAIKAKNREYFDKKDEIITTPFTFAATAETIVRSGATPVFVDIEPGTFNIDTKSIRKAINKNTVGILPVHLFGRSCEMGTLSSIAKENNLFIVEDVAQAFGAECLIDCTKKLGTIGSCGAFSFFPSKNLGSYGDAGAVSTNDQRLADLITALRNHGQARQYDATYIGYNSRLDSVQAAILLAKLRYIDKFNTQRIKVAQKYSTGLKNIKNIQLPSTDCRVSAIDYRHVYSLYTITVTPSLRNAMLQFLNERGIGARIYYPLPLHEMDAFKTAKVSGSLINAGEAAKSVLSLPINPFLKDREIEYIIGNIKLFSKS